MIFSFWKSRLPRQGWLYLSVHHMCFYAYILAKETKLIIRWADIVELNKTNSLVFPDSIRVVTRDSKEVRENYEIIEFSKKILKKRVFRYIWSPLFEKKMKLRETCEKYFQTKVLFVRYSSFFFLLFLFFVNFIEWIVLIVLLWFLFSNFFFLYILIFCLFIPTYVIYFF